MGVARAHMERPLERKLEHPTVGGSGQRIPLGEVLDVLEERGIPQVQGRDRGELAEHRGDTPLDAGPSAPMLDDDRSERAPLGDHRGDQQVLRIGQLGRQERVASRVELLDRQDVPPLPRSPDDPVGLDGRGRSWRDAVGREDDDPTVGLTEQQPAREPEPTDQRLKHDVRLLDRVSHGVELGADVHEGLQIGATQPQFALVESREDGGGDGEEPERGHVSTGNRSKVIPTPGATSTGATRLAASA